MKRFVIQLGIACAVFWPLISYAWHGSVAISSLKSTMPTLVVFALVYTSLSILMYLRRTRAR